MTTNKTFSVGETIFAKIKGYPHWPAVISSIEDGNKTILYNVTFLGTNETGLIKQPDIYKYLENIEKYGKPKTNNFRNAKFNNALLEAEKHFHNNLSPYCNTSIEELQEKILNLSAGDSLDHDTSLSLAAEVGNALLEENTLLKQQLHELKIQKSKSQLELEDKLKLSEEFIEEFKEKISMQEKEMEFIKNKLESERILKEDIIQQSEIEKCSLSTQVNNVLSTNLDLRNKIKQLETATNDKALIIDSLKATNYHLNDDKNTLEIELNQNKALVKELTSNYKEILIKLSEQETTARKHLNHLENILKTTNYHSRSGSTHNTNHQIMRQKNKQLYSVSLQVAKNKIAQLHCPSLEKELAQENLADTYNLSQQKQSHEAVKKLTNIVTMPDYTENILECINVTEGGSRILTNRPIGGDTDKKTQTLINNRPQNSLIRSHSESYEEFYTKYINHFKDLINKGKIILDKTEENATKNDAKTLPIEPTQETGEEEQISATSRTCQHKEKSKSKVNVSNAQFLNGFLEKASLTKVRLKKYPESRIFLHSSLKAIITMQQRQKVSKS